MDFPMEINVAYSIKRTPGDQTPPLPPSILLQKVNLNWVCLQKSIMLLKCCFWAEDWVAQDVNSNARCRSSVPLSGRHNFQNCASQMTINSFLSLTLATFLMFFVCCSDTLLHGEDSFTTMVSHTLVEASFTLLAVPEEFSNDSTTLEL